MIPYKEYTIRFAYHRPDLFLDDEAYPDDHLGSKRLTFAYVKDPVKNCIHYGYSVTNPNDTFIKAKGRELAMHRLKAHIADVDYFEDGFDLVGSIYKDDLLEALDNDLFDNMFYVPQYDNSSEYKIITAEAYDTILKIKQHALQSCKAHFNVNWFKHEHIATIIKEKVLDEFESNSNTDDNEISF